MFFSAGSTVDVSIATGSPLIQSFSDWVTNHLVIG